MMDCKKALAECNGVEADAAEVDMQRMDELGMLLCVLSIGVCLYASLRDAGCRARLCFADAVTGGRA